MDNAKTCRECGGPVRENEAVCEKCGRALKNKAVKTKALFTVLGVIIILFVVFLVRGMAPSAAVTFTGTGNNCPGGTLGLVSIVADRLGKGDIGMKATLEIKNFGYDGNAQKACDELKTGAKLYNKSSGYSETMYYTVYYEGTYKKGKYAVLDLYYFVNKDEINNDLRFSYNYTTKGGKTISIDVPCSFTAISADSGTVNTGETTIQIN